ncbi:MAG: ABC transporter ATP-binding protein [Bryobacteraceae bacterium]|nr:ABC transporter ATP-binding protein [Bryobacteraceae bacterium]
MIEVRNLRKTYGPVVAVDGATFEVRTGEVFGLLGPNGAGKTTTIHCISGLLKPVSGRVRVAGYDVVEQGRAARASIGVAPQELALYEDLSAAENLAYWGGVQGLRGAQLKQRIEETLELFGLQDRAREPVKRFSGGMKRRLNFACAVVHSPKVLLLDEPTVGVDPQSRVRLLEMVREQAAQGVCVLYTTHYMEEAEALCDRLAIMDNGRLIAQGTLAELRAVLGERELLSLTGTWEERSVRAALERMEGLEILQVKPEELTVAAVDASARLAKIFGLLGAAGAEIRGATVRQPSLESLFIRLTGKELRE